jgi:hypothetical protein
MYQGNNNRTSGISGQSCDAGTPISGKTAAGVYQIVLLNPDGSLKTGVGYLGATFPYLVNNAQSIVQNGGALAANTFIGSISLGTLAEGVYRVNPQFSYSGITGGGISFVLYSTAGALGAYIGTLVNSVPFNPNQAQLQQGLAGYWHNTASQQIGGGGEFIAYNRNNSLDIFLAAGNYGLAMVTDGTVNINAGSISTAGFTDFSKLG